MRAFIRWFRRGVPGFSMAQVCLALFASSLLFALAAEGTDTFLAAYTTLPQYHVARVTASVMKEFLPLFACGIGGFVMLIWAFARALRYHPLTNRKYLAWLRATPWQPGKPLPLGPIGVSTQDCIVLAAVSLLTYFFTPLDVYIVPMIFLTGYCLAALWILVRAGDRPYTYAAAFGFGVPLGLLAWPWASCAALVVLYGVAHRGLERSLYRFPWEPDAYAITLGGKYSRRRAEQVLEQVSPRLVELGDVALSHLADDLGWPLRALRLRWQRPWFSRIDAVLLALLPGYYIAVATFVRWSCLRNDMGVSEGNSAESLAGSLFCLFMIAAIIRLMRYSNGYGAPISLLGRLFTGRIIIPQYDVIFAAPLAALLAGFCIVTEMERRGFGSGPSAAVSITVFLLILLNGGPSLSKWRLTGAFRISHSAVTRKPEYVKL